MLKAIKIRLYLNNEQEQKINSLLGSYRFVFNQCLSYKKKRYDSNKQNTSLSDLGHFFHSDLRNEYIWLKEHNTKVLKQSIINLEQAYKNFFKLHNGFPKFKSKNDEQKVRFPQEAVASKTFDEENSRLNLNKTSIFGFSSTIIDPKDPIVFEYCGKNIIRVITKWGIEASDPILVNEKLN